LYTSGISSVEIGKELDYTSTTIRNVLVKNNIPRRGQSEAQPKMMGPNSPNWIVGTQKYWNDQCKIRDDYTCQICGFREPEIMNADHILPKSVYSELKFELNNLVTLCPNCHARKTIRERKTKQYKSKE
jgi:hypothetical protein